ncbi:ABC transporter [Corynebacterium sp. NML 120412]|uniref:ABC transporter ATP-binding protein n=1 Tax=Corynebacterium sp. NML 120412 TaxID=2029401 RepID=UPI000BAA7FE8|nr:ABC transporter ATP-binding protein [Corynebacterium sp. NML 120412]PAT14684.1 ABC transporter [Corynebacterium sp. NML 120412]
MQAYAKPTVVVRDVTKTYSVYPGGSSRSLFGARKKVEVEALKSISFATFAGESIGVLGRNGSGKSTLLSIIAGNESPTTGEVLVSAPPTLLGVSAVLQPHLSGRANVRLGLLAMGLSPDEASELESSVADWADIGDAINRPLKTYSSGMKARLRFSISTAVKHEILLVDEALSTGDATFAARAKERMDSFLDSAGTIFLVSHGPAAIKTHCTRALWIHDGTFIADGPADEISDAYRAWSSFSSQRKYDKMRVIVDRIRAKYGNPPQIVLGSELDHS